MLTKRDWIVNIVSRNRVVAFHSDLPIDQPTLAGLIDKAVNDSYDAGHAYTIRHSLDMFRRQNPGIRCTEILVDMDVTDTRHN